VPPSPRTLKLTAPYTRVPDAVNACSASLGVTFVDVSIAAVAIDSLITAELALDVVAKAAGGRRAFVSGASKERIIKCNVARSYGRSYGFGDICGNSADEDESNEAEDCELHCL